MCFHYICWKRSNVKLCMINNCKDPQFISGNLNFKLRVWLQKFNKWVLKVSFKGPNWRKIKKTRSNNYKSEKWGPNKGSPCGIKSGKLHTKLTFSPSQFFSSLLLLFVTFMPLELNHSKCQQLTVNHWPALWKELNPSKLPSKA